MADEKRKRSPRKPKPEQVEDESRSQVERATTNVLRTSGPAHATYFLAVVVGAFLLNLLVLVLITGG